MSLPLVTEGEARPLMAESLLQQANSGTATAGFKNCVNIFATNYDATSYRVRGDSIVQRNLARRQMYAVTADCSFEELTRVAEAYGFGEAGAHTQEQELQKSLHAFLRCEPYRRSALARCYDAVRFLLLVLVFIVGLIPPALLAIVVRLVVNPILRILHRCWSTRRPMEVEHRMPNLALLAPAMGEAISCLAGAEIVVEGAEHLMGIRDHPERYMAMFSHASGIDPFVIMQGLGGFSAFLWTYKSVLLAVPGFFLVAYGVGCEDGALNRGDREKAVRTCARLAKSLLPPMAAPEGTRSASGLVAPELKKGMFYVRQDREAHFSVRGDATSSGSDGAGGGTKILPIVLLGNYELWPTKQLAPTMGTVKIKVLPAVEVDTSLGRAGMDEAREKIRRTYMEVAASQSLSEMEALNRVSWLFLGKHFLIWLPFWAVNFWLVCAGMVYAYSGTFHLLAWLHDEINA